LFGVEADSAETIRLIESSGYQGTVYHAFGGDDYGGGIENANLLFLPHGYLYFRPQIVGIVGVEADK